MISIFSAIISHLAWGSGDTLGAYLSRKIDNRKLLLGSYITRLVFYTLLIPFHWHLISRFTQGALILNIFSGISSVLGYIFFLKATRLVHPAIAGALAGGWGISAFFYSAVFLHEPVTIRIWILSAVIFSGMILISYELTRTLLEGTSKRVLYKIKGLIYAILSMLLWGVCGSFIKIPSQTYGWFWTTYFIVLPFFGYEFVRIVFASLQGESLRSQFIKLLTTHKAKPCLQGLALILSVAFYGLLIAVGESSYNLALERGNASVVAPIGGSYIILYTLLSFIIFKDPLSWIQKLGVIISVLGILVLVLLGV